MAEGSQTWHGASIGAWLATVVILAGVVVGGIALIYWNWPMFWTGVGLFVAGWIAAYFANIMGAVQEYSPPAQRSS